MHLSCSITFSTCISCLIAIVIQEQFKTRIKFSLTLSKHLQCVVLPTTKSLFFVILWDLFQQSSFKIVFARLYHWKKIKIFVICNKWDMLQVFLLRNKQKRVVSRATILSPLWILYLKTWSNPFIIKINHVTATFCLLVSHDSFIKYNSSGRSCS